MTNIFDRVYTHEGSLGNAMPLNKTQRPQQRKYDVLVLDAMLRQSLVTVRSLGRRGLRVAAMETFDSVPTFLSRWCHQAFVCPTDGRAETYCAALEQVLEQTNAGVLIASSNATVELIRQHREKLEKRICIALSKDPALGIALHKELTLSTAREQGLHIPRSVTVNSESEVEYALREIGLPAVIKPVESWVWREQEVVGLTSKLVVTLHEAQRAVADMTRHGVAVLFQQFLSGRREAMHLFYAHGQFYASFAQWAKRTAPPLGGTSVLRQSIAIPGDIGDQSQRLIQAIGLEGYSEVEFRRDSAGTPYLMEINPRLSASVELAVRSGVDFPYLLYQWATGEQIPQVKNYRVGEWMRYLRGDAAATLVALLQHGRPGITPPFQALLDFGASCLIPMRYDYFDWKDPLPALGAALDFAHYLVHFPGKKLFKRES
jgi:predicted ATP-grasp superfamily ATP-dependent carboligase